MAAKEQGIEIEENQEQSPQKQSGNPLNGLRYA